MATSATLIGVVLLARSFGALDAIELDAVDARFELRGPQPPPPGVVIVDIDAASFEDLREQWPFPRDLHARLIDRLVRAKAAVIAYDVQFTEPTPEDAALKAAIARARGRVALATTEVNDAGETNVLGGERVLRRIGARAGSVLLPPDIDGSLRRIRHTIDRLETLPVVTAELLQRRAVRRGDFPGDAAWIDFRGPPGTIRSVSFSHVLDGRVGPGLLRDKVVVVGSSAPTLQDLHPTATTAEDLMSGAEIQANAIWTVLQDTPLRRTSRWLEVVLIVALGLVAPVAGARLRRLTALAIVLAAAAGWAIAAYLLFLAGVVAPVVYPLAALLLATTGSLALWLAGADYERRLVREGFMRFVPASVVGQVLQWLDGGDRPQVESLDCTVVFVDLRGSTAWAELLPPGKVFDVLNWYSTEMIEAVERHHGTVVDLRGDGILAVFGAPVRRDRHADHALAAVREMSGVHRDVLNASVREHGLGEGFDLGIGVSSGAVTSGVVGSRKRLEFTIVGDTVHRAARLQDLTKETPYQVLVSDNTRGLLVGDASDLEYVRAVSVRGKQVEIVLWGLASARTSRQQRATEAGPFPADAADRA
jgi:adenylate cyclase